jgi:hypothetical protein
MLGEIVLILSFNPHLLSNKNKFMEQNIQLQNNEPIKGSKNILIIIVSAIILFFIIVSGIIYFWQNSKIVSLKNDLLATRQQLTSSASKSEYKEFKLLNLKSEVPKNWSILKIPEMVGSNQLLGMPTGAIGKTDITHGDLNWEQVNLYFASQDIIDDLIQESKNNKYNTNSTWTTEIIDGIKAEVNIYPLDEQGSVSKGGTGGKRYFLSLPDNYNIKTLVIWKQTKGGSEFEAGFKHFLNNIKFSN